MIASIGVGYRSHRPRRVEDFLHGEEKEESAGCHLSCGKTDIGIGHGGTYCDGKSMVGSLTKRTLLSSLAWLAIAVGAVVYCSNFWDKAPGLSL